MLDLEKIIMPRLRQVTIVEARRLNGLARSSILLKWEDGITTRTTLDTGKTQILAQKYRKMIGRPLPADLYIQARCSGSAAELVREAAEVIKLRIFGDASP